MTRPPERETSTVRSWAACALVAAGAAWLLVGILLIGDESTDRLAWAIAPAVVLVTAGAALTR